jgi:hypothetical protein
VSPFAVCTISRVIADVADGDDDGEGDPAAANAAVTPEAEIVAVAATSATVRREKIERDR